MVPAKRLCELVATLGEIEMENVVRSMIDVKRRAAGIGATPGDERVQEAIARTQGYLRDRQHEKGYWVGELEADASVTAGFIPLMYLLEGRVDPARQRKAVNQVMSKQLPDGSWSTYWGGPGDLNVTIQVYFALKLAGASGDEPHMRLARDWVLSHGGITRSNALTKIWLALFGQYDWRGTPTLPPELVYLPSWFYVSIYDFASWSRETIMALILLLTRKPVFPLPQSAQVSDLFVEPPGKRIAPLGKADRFFSWKKFFLIADRAFKAYERLPWKPGRGTAMRRTERWVVEHQEPDGSWGGIMLPWVYSLFALKALGYKRDHPVMENGIAGLEDFIAEEEYILRLQPATSPVWDTAWTVLALRESGVPADSPGLVKAARWLLKEEIRVAGDWKVKNRGVEAGCWAFEFENDCYPDIDDTAVVPRSLLRVKLPAEDEEYKLRAVGRALRWVTAMQNRDGGFAAFDRDNNRQILAHIPFADFMTPLDPASPDVTAHAMEFLGERAPDGQSLAIALSYIKKEQLPDGPWYGRWGVNYIYGTGLVLTGLKAAGEDMSQEWIKRAARWLELRQNSDGGWGESCNTYDDPSLRGRGQSTASQTAWALMGLLAAREPDSCIRRGIDYLVRTQQEGGDWIEEPYTGTGFPKTFYLRYDMYRIYFPLMALARYAAALKGPGS